MGACANQKHGWSAQSILDGAIVQDENGAHSRIFRSLKLNDGWHRQGREHCIHTPASQARWPRICSLFLSPRLAGPWQLNRNQISFGLPAKTTASRGLAATAEPMRTRQQSTNWQRKVFDTHIVLTTRRFVPRRDPVGLQVCMRFPTELSQCAVAIAYRMTSSATTLTY